MTEVRRDLIPVKVTYVCDKCVKGNMVQRGGIAEDIEYPNPAVYEHVCSYCGAKKNFKKKYPYIEHREEYA